MMNLVDRQDLQELSRVRLKEATALLKLGLFDGAYYLAGYAVECALKACIAKAT
jgi:HEPN domain-containing protein